MPIFFRISKDGNYVHVAKTLVSKSITEKDFDERAKKISVEEFLSKFSSNMVAGMSQNIQKIKKINDMGLAHISVIKNICSPEKGYRYHIGINGRNFTHEEFENEKEIIQEWDEAMDYGSRLFGSETMEKYIKKIPNTYGPWEMDIYFSKDSELTCTQYYDLKRELNDLTNIVCLQKEEKVKFSSQKK